MNERASFARSRGSTQSGRSAYRRSSGSWKRDSAKK